MSTMKDRLFYELVLGDSPTFDSPPWWDWRVTPQCELHLRFRLGKCANMSRSEIGSLKPQGKQKICISTNGRVDAFLGLVSKGEAKGKTKAIFRGH